MTAQTDCPNGTHNSLVQRQATEPLEHGEHPSVVLWDICQRPRPAGHVIVFANQKGGVGKSTLAFHCAIALARSGAKVLAIDLDRDQCSLDHAICNREATARALGTDLPTPIHFVLKKPSTAMLLQEIARVGSDTDFIIIDVPGHVSPIERRAIALADTIVTPVNASFVDLDTLARFNPATMEFASVGQFGGLIKALQEEKWRRGRGTTDWLLLKNRTRGNEVRQLARIDAALEQLPAHLGLRIASGLAERVAYRELFLFGLTHADLKKIPGLSRMRVRGTGEIDRLIEEMRLPSVPSMEYRAAIRPSHSQSRPPTMQRYRQSLRSQFGKAEDLLAHS